MLDLISIDTLPAASFALTGPPVATLSFPMFRTPFLT